MTDSLLQMGLSNACFALALAIVAMVVGAKARRPHLAYLLWLLVFVKLLTPPLVTILDVTIPAQTETAVITNDHSRPGPPLSNSREINFDTQPDASVSSRIGSVTLNHGKEWLASIWLWGSVFVFTWSLVRIYRFNRLLGMESEVAPPELQTVAVRIANRLGLKAVPTIYMTSAHLSPLVWWIGGKVRIVIPAELLDQMDAQQSQWILAHELAHVRRRDYLVRWLEWLACICFWWNPVTWWARRNLRANEEICCDALVVSSLKPKPNSYANSLLTAIECLACPALRPPAIASEINSGGFLERRFKMIVSNNLNRPRSRWLQGWVLLGAVLVLPFGVAFAQDYDAVGRRLRAAVQAGELTGEQARAMLETLRKSAAKDKKEVDYEAIGKKIRAAVAAGKITAEEGRAKMTAIKKDAAKKDAGSDRAKAYLMKVKKELGAAVESGRISREDAAKRYQAAEKGIKERMAAGRGERGSKRITREDYAQAEAKMRKMVEEGKAKPEDVRRRLIEMRKEMGKQASHDKKGITVEEYRRAEAKMRRMVEEGKAKPEDVERRLLEMRKMMGEQSKRGEKVDWDAIKRRIEGAVKRGDITRKEADAKYKEIKRRIAGQTDSGSKRISRDDLERAAIKLRKAVAEGKMSGEDARDKIEAMRKMMGEQGERGRGTNARDPKAVYEAAEKEIKAAIAAGKITEEQGKARLEGLKKRLAQEAREAWIRENLGNRREQGARDEKSRGDRR